ncbi:MAG: acylhydrolase [Lachnospiraceae bacterium]|nr:acylhydrolase [Lachnospiraceae bacterium]
MKTVLCYGDSNTYGYNPSNGLRYPKEVRWTGRLKEMLGEEYEIIEEGCNGRTTVYGLPYEEWKKGITYLRPCLNSHKPIDLVVLMLGSNDLKEGFCASPEDIAAGAGKLVDVIKEFTEEKQGFIPKIILVSPIEVGEDIDDSLFNYEFTKNAIAKSKEFHTLYQKVARQKGCIYFNAAEYVKPSKEDSLHMTEEGHKIFAEKMAEIIQKIEW